MILDPGYTLKYTYVQVYLYVFLAALLKEQVFDLSVYNYRIQCLIQFLTIVTDSFVSFYNLFFFCKMIGIFWRRIKHVV